MCTLTEGTPVFRFMSVSVCRKGLLSFFARGCGGVGGEPGALRCFEVPVTVKEETLSMLIFYTGMCLCPRNLGTQD